MRTETHTISLPDGRSATLLITTEHALERVPVKVDGHAWAIPPGVLNSPGGLDSTILQLRAEKHARAIGAELRSDGEGEWPDESDVIGG